MNVTELDAEIQEASGYEPDDLADLPGRIDKIDWAGSPSWATGKPVPGAANMMVYAMYGSSSDDKRVQHVEYVIGDIRVYAFPVQSLPGESPCRYTINRASPGIVREPLSKDALVTEIAREIEELASLDESLDEECEKCGAVDVPTGSKFCNSCGAQMPEEPEEEPETPEPANMPS